MVAVCLIFNSAIFPQTSSEPLNKMTMFPKNHAVNVNIDTHLQLIFTDKPALGSKGMIRIYDKSNDKLVDSLDLSIPPGPTKRSTAPKAPYIKTPYKYISGNFTNANTKPGTPSGGAMPTPDNYQLTIIGGFTDGFHFYPVIIHHDTATIYLHNNLLEYAKTYYVQIDPDVFVIDDNSFKGISGKDAWVFSTKKSRPSLNTDSLVVNADGTEDFNTVQGAVDFIPDYNQKHTTIFVKNGLYEEIVYFRNKTNITFIGEDRDKAIIQYANKEVFNPHPSNISTNEVEGTFPSRRAAFAVDNSSKISLINLTIRSTSERAQAEGLLINGSENIVYNLTIGGSGDALQSNGSAYYYNSRIEGWGDLVLGGGPAFFKDCELSAIGPYMWIRNTSANHGNVFVDCKFITPDDKETVIARAPTNGGKNYPYCEAVLINCKLKGISPVGWGPVGGDLANVHYWEYNSTNLDDGRPVDTSQRSPTSHQLTIEKDSVLIIKYSDPSFVLSGWEPTMSPIIISQPESIMIKAGQTAHLKVEAAAIPQAIYQWFFNDKIIDDATNSILNIKKVSSNDSGNYFAIIKNSAGSVKSHEIKLEVE